LTIILTPALGVLSNVLTVVAMMVILLLIFAGIGHNSFGVDDHDGPQKTVAKSGQDGKKPPAAKPPPRPDKCPGGHRVKLDPRKQSRYISNGIKAASTPAMKKEIALWLAHDPVGLFAYHSESPAGEIKAISSQEKLVLGGFVQDGNCYSRTGVAAYNDWLLFWKAAKVKPTASMPPNWNNSGVSGGQGFSGPPPTGNTSGWIVTYVDANGNPVKVVGVMKRCGNLVTPQPFLPPKAPPPEQPPPPPEKPPPPPPPPHRTPKCAGHPFPQICGTPNRGPEQQKVQAHKQPPTPGYPGRGHLENVQAQQPVGPRGPTEYIPPTRYGYNSGSPSGAPKGGDLDTGEVGSDKPNQSGGTHGDDQDTNVSNQPPNSGDVGPPP
jgi:hypothetical protein